MARNFGFHAPIRRSDRARAWTMWVAALVAIGVISAATFLSHR
jgi:hypothetical protein